VVCVGVFVFGLAAVFMRSFRIMRGNLEGLQDMTSMSLRLAEDQFHVTVLEVKSEPGSFTERVRVRCDHDMDAGIWVTDLKEAGIFETRRTNGDVFYREGQPHKAGQSGTADAGGATSMCEILFKVSATLTNTIWHSEISAARTNGLFHGSTSGASDTTLPIPMAVSEVRTNWPGAYPRGSSIPLANLGDYKVLLTVK
jgi:hypothetical protein